MSSGTRYTWAERKQRFFREAIEAMWAGLPVIPNHVKNHMDSLTPIGGMDGGTWADWFREGRIPRSVEEATAALRILVRAYAAAIAFDEEQFCRMRDDKDQRISEALARARAAEARVAELEEQLKRLEPLRLLHRLVGAVRATLALIKLKLTGTKSVKLVANGPNRILVIKTIRELTNLGLKEAKEMTEKGPVVLLENAPIEQAMAWQQKLTEAGATVELV